MSQVEAERDSVDRTLPMTTLSRVSANHTWFPASRIGLRNGTRRQQHCHWPIRLKFPTFACSGWPVAHWMTGASTSAEEIVHQVREHFLMKYAADYNNVPIYPRWRCSLLIFFNKTFAWMQPSNHICQTGTYTGPPWGAERMNASQIDMSRLALRWFFFLTIL